MEINLATRRGRRESNEDAHSIILNRKGKFNNFASVSLIGIFDGHGGHQVSRILPNVLPNYFMDKRVTYPLSETYVNNVFEYVQKMLKTKHKKFSKQVGSTSLLSIFFHKNKSDYLQVINLGDSRCVLSKNKIAIPLSKDHKPMWPEEKARILKLGGQLRVDGNELRIKDLSVSRSLGDADAEPYVSHIPDLFTYKITKEDQFIIMACDGLWDVVDSQDAVNFVLSHCYDKEVDINPKTHRKTTKQVRIAKQVNVAELLADYALQKGTTDNLTIMVVFLN